MVLWKITGGPTSVPNSVSWKFSSRPTFTSMTTSTCCMGTFFSRNFRWAQPQVHQGRTGVQLQYLSDVPPSPPTYYGTQKKKHWEFVCFQKCGNSVFSVFRSAEIPSKFRRNFSLNFRLCSVSLWAELTQAGWEAGAACGSLSTCREVGESSFGADSSMLQKHWKTQKDNLDIRLLVVQAWESQMPKTFLLHQRRAQKVAEISRKSRKLSGISRQFAEIRGKSQNQQKVIAQQLALRDAHGNLHRHTLLLHQWFFTSVEGCPVLRLGKLASTYLVVL